MQKGVIPLELFRLLGTIAINNKEANDALDETTDKGAKSEKKLSKSFGKIGGAALKIGTAMGAAALAAGAALVKIANDTREYRAEMGKLEAAFTTAGHSAESATATYNALNTVLGDTGQAVEASNHLAKLVTDEKDLATWTNICTGVYATFGASLPIEGLTEAANETSRTGQLTGGLADALNWAGVNEEEFQASLDKCTTQQERQALITETLNGLYSDAAKKYKEVNKDVLDANAAQGKLNEGLAAIGAIVEPVITKLTFLAGTVLLKVADAMVWVVEKGTDLIKKIKEVKDRGLQIFTQFKNGVETTMTNIVTSVKNKVDSIISWVQSAIAKIKELFTLQGMQSSAAAAAESKANRTSGGAVAAHAAGGILTKPTIFGYTPSTGTWHLGGEAGAEAIAPIDVLQGYVRSAVAAEMSGGIQTMIGLLEKLVDKDTKVYLNSKEISKAVNKDLGVVF